MSHDYPTLNQENSIFILVSFEGPDKYALAGGLGVRMTELSQALAERGFETYLLFVGDPNSPAEEQRLGGKLHLWRCCQEISRYHPKGVYEGEDAKRERFNQVVPQMILDRIARRAAAEEKLLVILGEDWHTAATMSAISDLLFWNGLRRRAILLWNANNTFGFDRIDWPRLRLTTWITTVSRYMKHLMRPLGLNPLVIPNGIPARYLEPVDPQLVGTFRTLYKERLTLTKVARFDPNKNWIQAVRAVAQAKTVGMRPIFFMRGGIEPHGLEVLHEVERLGLKRVDLHLVSPTPTEFLQALRDLDPAADVVYLSFFVPEDVQRLLYCASNGVLANSGHEPFGLVGLEVMATRGVAITGSTGEDYAQHLLNAIVLDTDDPSEIIGNLLHLREHSSTEFNLRRVGRITSQFYIWDRVIQNLVSTLQYLVMTDDVLFAGHSGRVLPLEIDPQRIKSQPPGPR